MIFSINATPTKNITIRLVIPLYVFVPAEQLYCVTYKPLTVGVLIHLGGGGGNADGGHGSGDVGGGRTGGAGGGDGIIGGGNGGCGGGGHGG